MVVGDDHHGGYGDIFPFTPLGRFVGVFTMVVGICTFAVVTAKAAEFLVRADLDDQRTDLGSPID